MDLFKLVGTIAVENAVANKNIDTTTQKADGLSSKLKNGMKTVGKWGAAIATAGVAAGTAAAVGVKKLATEAAATADNVDKMSQKIGISRQAYQELDFICSQTGTSVDTLKMGLKTMTGVMKTTADGTSKSKTALEELGISATDSKGKLRDQEEVMWEALSTLQGMENQTEKAALANKLFGRSGSELMPLLNGASGSIEKMKKQAHELGLVLDDDAIDSGVELTDTMDQMDRAIKGITTRIGAKFMPKVTEICKWVIKNLPKVESVFNSLSDKLKQAGSRIMPVLKSALKKLKPVIVDLANNAFKNLKSAIDLVADAVEIAADGISNFYNWVKKNPSAIRAMVTVMGALYGAYVGYNTALKINTAIEKVKAVLDAAHLAITKAKTAADEGATIAQIALNAAMNANPVMLLVTGIGLLVGAIASYAIASGNATESTNKETIEHKKLAESLKEQKEQIDQLHEQSATTASESMAQMDYTNKLAKELDGLADSTGKVKKKDKERAEFIINQLNEALGTEYKMTGNQIQNYDKLQNSIKATIKKKRQELLLAAYEEEYKDAIKQRAIAQKNLEKATVNYGKAKEKIKNAEKDYKKTVEEQTKVLKDLQGKNDKNSELQKIQAEAKIKSSKMLVDAAKKEAEEESKKYKKAISNLSNYQASIKKYEKASEEALKGHTKKAEKILSSSNDEFLDIGKNYTLGLKKGIENKDATSQLYASVANVVNNAIKKAKKEADVHSPSKKTQEIGKYLSLGFAVGIKAKESDVINQIGSSMNKWMSSLQSKCKKLVNGIQSTLKSTLDKKDFESIGKTVVDKLSSGFESRISSFKTTIENIKSTLDTALSEIASKRDALKEKLASTDLFTKDENGKLTLNSFSNQIKAIKKYQKNIKALKNKISDELMEKIVDMDSEDGLAFTNKLLSLSSKDLKKYNQDYSTLLSTSGKISNSYYAKDVTTAKNKAKDATAEAVTKLNNSLAKIMTDVLTKNVKIKLNEREIGRVVKKYVG